jgi:hypothetical protein
VSFCGFDCFLLLVVVGARNKFESTLLTLVLTSLKSNIQFICRFSYTLFHSVQVILNQFLAHHNSLKTRSQIDNLSFYLSVLFDRMKKLTLETPTNFTSG